MNKKSYISPEYEIDKFQAEDLVLTLSGDGNEGSGGNTGEIGTENQSLL